MKIQIEQLVHLFVVRILTKRYSRCRSYLLTDNRKWSDRELTYNELWKMKFKIISYTPKEDDS